MNNQMTESLLLTERYDATALAREIIERLYPNKKDDSVEIEACIRDMCFHINVLGRSVNTNDETLFNEYLAWTTLVLEFIHHSRKELITELTELSNALSTLVDKPHAVLIEQFISTAIKRINNQPLTDIEGLEVSLKNNADLSTSLGTKTSERLAALALAIFYMRNPELAITHKLEGQNRCYKDVCKHINVLERSIEAGNFNLFAEYSRWTAQFLHWYGISRVELSGLFEAAAMSADLCLSDDLAGAAAESLLEAARIVREENVTPTALMSIPGRSAMARVQGDSLQCLRQSGNELARLSLTIYYMRYPEVSLKFGEAGRSACLNDTIIHFEHLTDAILAESKPVFIDYLNWVASVLMQVGIKEDSLMALLDCMNQAIQLSMPEAIAQEIIAFIQESANSVDIENQPVIDSYIDESKQLGPLARDFHNHLLEGDRHAASELIMQAMKSGTSLQSIYLDVFQNSQYEIGRLWQRNKISVAQEHFCTAATQMIMSQMYPYIFQHNRRERKLVATCATEDMHEIGIRMVCDFYEMEGWDTFYLGANSPVDAIVSAVLQNEADILAISVTISTHIGYVRDIITAIRANEVCAAIPIIVGGIPFLVDKNLCSKIGANGFAANALDAVELGKKLVS